MIVRCPSCGVSLRLNEERLAGHSSAKCPQCRNAVPLSSPAGASRDAAGPEPIATIKVECGACGAKLKAPATTVGSRSHCPRCRAEVVISASSRPMPAAARGPLEDSSGAATRRIDSRTLALPGSARMPSESGGMDLEAFIKAADPQPAPPPIESPSVTPSLMKPPVAEIERIAGEIRSAARAFDPANAPAPQEDSALPRPTTHPPELKLTKDAASHLRSSRQDTPSRASEPFPAARGLAFGGLAGLLVGGASAAGMTFLSVALARFIAPLPFGENLAVTSSTMLRVALPALLGAIAGFIAAAAGSPTRQDRPLRALRACGFAVLAGLACGMVTSLTNGQALKVWPIATWMRDLLIAGVITSSLDRIVPALRS